MNDKWILLKYINQNKLRYTEISALAKQMQHIFSKVELMCLIGWLQGKNFIVVFKNCDSAFMIGVTSQGIRELAVGDCNG